MCGGDDGEETFDAWKAGPELEDIPAAEGMRRGATLDAALWTRAQAPVATRQPPRRHWRCCWSAYYRDII